MKTFIIIIIIYLLALKTKEVERVVLIQDNESVNIIINDSLLICKSVLGFEGRKWTHPNKVTLKSDKTEFGFVPFEGMRIEIEIYKY